MRHTTPPLGKKALPPWEQSAALLWLVEDGWNVFADALDAEGLLQVELPFANKQATWLFVWHAWGRAFGASCKVVATKGILSRTTMASLQANLKDQAHDRHIWHLDGQSIYGFTFGLTTYMTIVHCGVELNHFQHFEGNNGTNR